MTFFCGEGGRVGWGLGGRGVADPIIFIFQRSDDELRVSHFDVQGIASMDIVALSP